MALVLRTFIGAETGGFEEVSTLNSPTVDSTIKRTGTYSYKLPSAASAARVRRASTTGDDQILGFGLYYDSVTPVAAIQFFMARDNGITVKQWYMELQTNGDIKVYDANAAAIATITTPIPAGVWHYIEVAWQNLDSGNIDIWIDGVSKVSLTGKDLLSSVAYGIYEWSGGASGDGVNLYIDDIYIYTGGSGTSSFLGGANNFVEVLGPYGNTVEDATDVGSSLADGTWALVSEVPANEGTSNDAQYTVNPSSGSTTTDEGTTLGPNADVRFTYGTLIAGKWIHRLKKGSGTSSHQILYGNNTDGTTSTTTVLTTAYVNYYTVSVDFAIVPLVTEYFRNGFGTANAADIFASDIWAMLLQTRPRKAPPPFQRQQRVWKRGNAA